MDKLYVPNYIDFNYKYAVFKENGDIELYEQEFYDRPGTYRYWILYDNNQNKIITDCFDFVVQEGQIQDIAYAHDIELSHKWYDRPDMLNILCVFCCVAATTLWFVNLFTSIFKKGGLLSGLF